MTELGGLAVPDDTLVETFTGWATEAEPRLRGALTASFGHQIGREATADALAHAWEHWSDIEVKENALGYVFGVGRNMARRMTTVRRPELPPVAPDRLPNVEPGLPDAVSNLPEQQRTVVVLLHGYGWTMSEVAELLDVAKSTVQTHAERGMAALRDALGVES